jgi:hypothetical protein
MTQQLPDHSTAQPVSTVTKHIKIYSDNPIHDCIDRIINSCICIDEDDDYRGLASVELYEATLQLLMLATDRMVLINIEYLRQKNGAKSN